MKGWVIHSWRIKLVQNKIVFEIRHYNVNFENILFRWYSSQDALVWLFSYSKVGVYILEFLIRQESKRIIWTWLCRRRKIVLENSKSIRNQQFFLYRLAFILRRNRWFFLRSSSGWLYAQDKKMNTIYTFTM